MSRCIKCGKEFKNAEEILKYIGEHKICMFMSLEDAERNDIEVRKHEREKVITELKKWLDNTGYDVYVGDSNYIKGKKLEEKLNEIIGE